MAARPATAAIIAKSIIGRSTPAPHGWVGTRRHAHWPLLLYFLAHSVHAQMSIGVGRDVHFAPGTQTLFLNYQPLASHLELFAAAWRGQYYGQAFGADYRCNFGRLFGAFGAAYLPDPNQISGTRGNFAIHLGYRLSRQWSVTLRHFSNGKQIFHWTTRPNEGWNFLSIEYTLDPGAEPGAHDCMR